MPAVPIYGAIDPGINEDHKVGIVFAWLDGKDVLEVFHAHKESGWTVEDTAAHFHNVCAALHFKPRWTVIDPSARNKAHATGRSVQDEYRKHGIHTIPGQNSREAGFNAVKERLRTERLILHGESCDQLIHEFHEYRWKRSRGRSEDAPKAEPIKINDDLLDALRYLVMSMPRGPEPVEQDPDRGLSDADRSFRQSLIPDGCASPSVPESADTSPPDWSSMRIAGHPSTITPALLLVVLRSAKPEEQRIATSTSRRRTTARCSSRASSATTAR
jgi:hypothetical protein